MQQQTHSYSKDTIYCDFIFSFSNKFKNTLSPKNTDLKKGLIRYYSFNDKATDESGNNNHGELDGVSREKDVNGEQKDSYRWYCDNSKTASIYVDGVKTIGNILHGFMQNNGKSSG